MNIALYLALIVIFIGIDLILANYILMGLILIGIYVGAIIILILFVVMNTEFLNSFSLSFWDYFLISLIILLFKNDFTFVPTKEILGVLLFEEYSIFTLLLAFLLLITLILCHQVIKRL